ncbi:hypothetical protein [Endozoicomonas sp. Mp262]|uniref:hypothetical protein n=1 Tax=Endozoicomonas sp. Mp262 TaxID=2919499 RepID=UPI0021DAF6D3
METRAIILGMALLMPATETLAGNIYKCMVNGRVEFSGEPCGANARPVVLKELAAPLASYDMKGEANLDYTIKSHLLRERVARHQHKIQRYRHRMDAEIKKVYKKNPSAEKTVKARYVSSIPSKKHTAESGSSLSLANKSTNPASRLKVGERKSDSSRPAKNTNHTAGVLEDQLGNIADAVRGLNQDSPSSQVNAITQRYSALIKAEEFQINLLLQKIRELR